MELKEENSFVRELINGNFEFTRTKGNLYIIIPTPGVMALNFNRQLESGPTGFMQYLDPKMSEHQHRGNIMALVRSLVDDDLELYKEIFEVYDWDLVGIFVAIFGKKWALDHDIDMWENGSSDSYTIFINIAKSFKRYEFLNHLYFKMLNMIKDGTIIIETFQARNMTYYYVDIFPEIFVGTSERFMINDLKNWLRLAARSLINDDLEMFKEVCEPFRDTLSTMIVMSGKTWAFDYVTKIWRNQVPSGLIIKSSIHMKKYKLLQHILDNLGSSGILTFQDDAPIYALKMCDSTASSIILNNKYVTIDYDLLKLAVSSDCSSDIVKMFLSHRTVTLDMITEAFVNIGMKEPGVGMFIILNSRFPSGEILQNVEKKYGLSTQSIIKDLLWESIGSKMMMLTEGTGGITSDNIKDTVNIMFNTK